MGVKPRTMPKSTLDTLTTCAKTRLTTPSGSEDTFGKGGGLVLDTLYIINSYTMLIVHSSTQAQFLSNMSLHCTYTTKSFYLNYQ